MPARQPTCRTVASYMSRQAASLALVVATACSVPSKFPASDDDHDEGAGLDASAGADASNSIDAGPDAPVARIDTECQGEPGGPRVLVYTQAIGYVHPAIPSVQEALRAMCQSQGFSVVVSPDPLALRTRLGASDVLVLAMVSGTVFPPDVRPVVEDWIRAGGGVVGIHTATTIDTDWAFFKEQIGATLKTATPGMWEGRLDRLVQHPIVDGLPKRWKRTDEWFVFENRPELNAGMTMLLALDEWELSWDYPWEYRVGFHPLVWSHERAGGRIVQSAIGHDAASYSDPAYLGFLARSIRWAARRL
jgi:uncharacterized protein